MDFIYQTNRLTTTKVVSTYFGKLANNAQRIYPWQGLNANPGVALPTCPLASGESKPTWASESYMLTRRHGEWNLLYNNYQ